MAIGVATWIMRPKNAFNDMQANKKFLLIYKIRQFINLVKAKSFKTGTV